MKNNKLAYLIIIVMIILFNIIAFIIPSNKNTTFFISYIFSMIALVSQIGIWKLAYNKDNEKNKILGYSVIHIGLIYLIAQLISFGIFMAIPNLETWISIVVSTLILGIFIIILTSTQVGINEINRVEEKIKNKVSYIKEMQMNVELLISKEENEEVKEKLKELLEKIRFSDPITNDSLIEIEEQISNKINNLKDEKNDKNLMIREIILLIDERNKKCKLLK